MIQAIYHALYDAYFRSYGKWKRSGKKIHALRFRLCAALAQRFFSGAFTRRLSGFPFERLPADSGRQEKIIASLTTFPARIDRVWIAIATILLQSVKPDAIELWLAREQFPHGLDSLPQSLLRLRDYGVEICFCEDLRSHKKYYYAMQKHPDAIVITFDDDIFYPSDTIARLLALHEKAPQDVIGMSTPFFTAQDFMHPLDWKMQNAPALSDTQICICGGGGTLFPPKALHEKAFDQEAIGRLAPLADDLWLTAMTYMNGRKITSAGRLPFPLSVQDTQEHALTKTNNSETSKINNNTQWAAILNAYSQELAEWIASVK